MKVFDSQGKTTLSAEKSALRLWDSGEVFPVSGPSNNLYDYDVDIVIPGADKPFLFCIKSDFDLIATRNNIYQNPSDFQGTQRTIRFVSSSGGPKSYRLYAEYDLQSYSTTTAYGIKLFTPDGSVAYDSRVPEAILTDVLDIPAENDSIITHVSSSPAWYALNMFPTNFIFIPFNDTTTLRVFSRGFRQISSTQTETDYALIGLTSGSAAEFNTYSGKMPIVRSPGLD